MCLLEHLPRLVAGGFRVFRVEGLHETAAYRSEIGGVYREALVRVFAGGEYALEDRWVDAAKRHAPRGLCNGYAFGMAGRKYVGTVLQDANPEV
jgi:collagenase-like PrtC family protease